MVEVINPSTRRYVEKIEINGNMHEIWGVKTSKSFRGWIQSKINHFERTENKEEEMKLRTILAVYDKFHPVTKVAVEIEGFKGKSGVRITEYPTYFETIQYRKTDTEVKEIKKSIPRWQVKIVLNVIRGLRLNEKYSTRYISQEYVKQAKITHDSKGRPFFDSEGWNFEMFFGDRQNYLPFNLCLKILEFYKVITYFKDGHVQKLKDSWDFD